MLQTVNMNVKVVRPKKFTYIHTNVLHMYFFA